MLECSATGADLIVFVLFGVALRTLWDEVACVLWREWRANKPMDTIKDQDQ